MANIYVKEMRVNGKKLRNVNGKKIHSLTYGENTYILQDTFTLDIYAHDDDDQSTSWELDAGTYVEIDFKTIKAANKTFTAGNRKDYDFDGWSMDSFYINADTEINGMWTYSPEPVLKASGYVTIAVSFNTGVNSEGETILTGGGVAKVVDVGGDLDQDYGLGESWDVATYGDDDYAVTEDFSTNFYYSGRVVGSNSGATAGTKDAPYGSVTLSYEYWE